MLPLFKHYPVFGEKLAPISLGIFPTPVQQLVHMGDTLGCAQLYIKRDDMSGGVDRNGQRLFGGNKVRKLEFLLSDALNNGAKSVLTLGCAGSNHVVATAAYAQHLGLRCIIPLKPQPNAHVVRRNLLLMHHYGAELSLSPDSSARDEKTIRSFFSSKHTFGDYPYFIPTGGSCPKGVVGFVNAALELKEQIDQHVLPEPDRIYVPAGSFGTAAGLLLGIKAANMKTKLVAVCVEPEETPGCAVREIKRLFVKTNQLLSSLDDSFPQYDYTSEDITIEYDFAGDEYGLFTQEGINAIKQLRMVEGINLDGTYSGKAFAALIHDMRKHSNEVILFWHTFCGDNFDHIIGQSNYHLLPPEFHHYFEDDVQALDK